MHGLQPSDVVKAGSFFTIWRLPNTIAMDARGHMGDVESDAWRAALAEERKRGGEPRFYAMDVSNCEPDNTMACRFRTASFCRDFLKVLESAVVFTSAKPGPLFVSRTLVRVIGMNNLVLTSSSDAFKRSLDGMKQGHKPAAGVA